VELRRPLPLVFYAHAKRALKVLRRFDDLLGDLAPDNSLLRRVPHLELTASYVRGGDNFKIRLRDKVPDFELAPADDRQGWRLDPANPNNAPRALTKNDGGGSRQRQVVDLVGWSARNGGGVKRSVFGVWFRPAECVADRLRVLTASMVGTARANLIVNGGFETNGGVGTGVFTGWTNPSGSGIVVDSGFQANGTYDAIFTASGALSQAVATTAGAAYTLTLNILDESGDVGDTFTVTFGTFTTTITGDNAATYTAETYSNPGADVVGTSTTLSFSGANAFTAWNLDDVTLTQTAAPEPASIALLAGATTLLAGMRKRRRNNV
jgi:hypothetical protein